MKTEKKMVSAVSLRKQFFGYLVLVMAQTSAVSAAASAPGSDSEIEFKVDEEVVLQNLTRNLDGRRAKVTFWIHFGEAVRYYVKLMPDGPDAIPVGRDNMRPATCEGEFPTQQAPAAALELPAAAPPGNVEQGMCAQSDDPYATWLCLGRQLKFVNADGKLRGPREKVEEEKASENAAGAGRPAPTPGGGAPESALDGAAGAEQKQACATEAEQKQACAAEAERRQPQIDDEVVLTDLWFEESQYNGEKAIVTKILTNTCVKDMDGQTRLPPMYEVCCKSTGDKIWVGGRKVIKVDGRKPHTKNKGPQETVHTTATGIRWLRKKCSHFTGRKGFLSGKRA